MSSHAVGIVCDNREETTQKTLRSLLLSDQPKETYDLFIIDNSGSKDSQKNIINWAKSNTLPIKNLLVLKKTISLSKAWNLFLYVTQEYDFRTKIDNDIILGYTPVSAAAPAKRNPSQAVPEAMVNPGAVQSASFVLGANSATKKKKNIHSCFLHHLQTYTQTHKVDISAVIPVVPKQSFMDSCKRLSEKRWRGYACLCGQCMMVTKKCFDKIGYFNEKYHWYFDYEYSQRAMANALNVGYVPDYYIVYNPNDDSERTEYIKSKQDAANQVSQLEGSVKKEYVSTKWSLIGDKILTNIGKSTVVNIS